MRIGRFLDGQGDIRWGDEAADGSVALLEGELRMRVFPGIEHGQLKIELRPFNDQRA